MSTLQDHRAEGVTRERGRWDFNSRFVIGKPGNPMMMRWRLLQTPLFGVYVHFIYREDLDPVCHDHPWRFWSLVLRGGYREDFRPDARYLYESVEQSHRRGSFHGFPLRACHRIVSVEPKTTTLVVVGRKLRSWGFYDELQPGHYIDWQDALGIRPTEGSRSTGKYPVAASSVVPPTKEQT